MEKKSSIYFVPTPIGNLKDISYRAVEILKICDIIYCEDTRNSGNLLKYYEIDSKLVSYHKYNENERVNEIISNIRIGKTVAIISDAGMPIINDPGSIILQEIINQNIDYEILPGPCALINGICGSGIDATNFVYMGFVPKTNSERKKYFEKFQKMEVTGIFYESPHRLIKTLEFLEEIYGNIEICVCRELTKLHEEYKKGNVREVLEYYKEKGVKGEIVLVVEKIELKEEVNIEKEIKELRQLGHSNKEIVKIITSKHNISKNKIYDLVLKI